MTPVMACLAVGDEDIRAVCVGCSGILHEKGMLRIVRESPFGTQHRGIINGEPHEFSIIVYAVADGMTLAQCQAEVAWRHVGPPSPWGS